MPPGLSFFLLSLSLYLSLAPFSLSLLSFSHSLYFLCNTSISLSLSLSDSLSLSLSSLSLSVFSLSLSVSSLSLYLYLTLSVSLSLSLCVDMLINQRTEDVARPLHLMTVADHTHTHMDRYGVMLACQVQSTVSIIAFNNKNNKWRKHRENIQRTLGEHCWQALLTKCYSSCDVLNMLTYTHNHISVANKRRAHIRTHFMYSLCNECHIHRYTIYIYLYTH